MKFVRNKTNKGILVKYKGDNIYRILKLNNYIYYNITL